MVFLSFFLEYFEVVVKFFGVELVKSFHLFVALFEVLDVVFHLLFETGVYLHAIDP